MTYLAYDPVVVVGTLEVAAVPVPSFGVKPVEEKQFLDRWEKNLGMQTQRLVKPRRARLIGADEEEIGTPEALLQNRSSRIFREELLHLNRKNLRIIYPALRK